MNEQDPLAAPRLDRSALLTLLWVLGALAAAAIVGTTLVILSEIDSAKQATARPTVTLFQADRRLKVVCTFEPEQMK